MEYPESYMKLKYKDRLFADCYLNESIVEPQTRKNTFCDKFAAFVFAYNVDLSDCLNIEFSYFNWDSKQIEVSPVYTPNCTTTITIRNAKKYMSIVANATKVFNRCNVAINDIRLKNYDSQDKTRVLELKDAIYNSSLHAGDFKDRNDNRKMAMKIFGLDQVKVDVGVDLYEAAGKNIFEARKHDEDMQREDAPIIPDVLEDLDLTEGDEEEKDGD